jgi:hypothetical protein
MKCSTTSLSAGVSLAGSGGAVAPAFCSTSFIMSNGILVADRQRFVDHLRDDRPALGDLALLLGLHGVREIAGCNLGTLAEVPGFKLMSMEAIGDDLLTTFLARRI